jgi:hypothetical protein
MFHFQFVLQFDIYHMGHNAITKMISKVGGQSALGLFCVHVCVRVGVLAA